MNIKFWAYIFGALFSFSVFGSNGWVSSGGDLYRSDKNPWFLQNTKTARFCVLVDSKGISISESDVKDHIRAAFVYWKKELSAEDQRISNGTQQNSSSPVKIGTQDFVEVKCDGTEDIRFVIGSGQLTKDQRAYIKDVRRHLGVAVRTDYDFVQLRGRGFVFIASDQGADKFESPIFNDHLWTQKNMLQGTVVHELGHVFGLPHMGTGLMSEAFAEKISSSVFFRSLTSLKELPPVLRIPTQSESCGIGLDVMIYFGVRDIRYSPQGLITTCLRLTWANPKAGAGESMIFRVSAVNDKAEVNLGLLTLPKQSEIQMRYPVDFSFNTAGLVYLSSQQKVFAPNQLLSFPDPADPTGKTKVTLDYLYGTAEVRYGLTSTLVLADGYPRSVYINFGPEGHRIQAQLNGETRLIFKTDSMWFF